MAIAKCRECGAEVSDQAKACPKCGISTPVKKTSLLAKIIAGFFGLVVAISVIGSAIEKDTQQPQKVVTEEEKKEEEMFNIAMIAARLLKKSAKDPSSFEITSLLLMDSGSACVEYNARNSFNAKVQGRAVQTPDLKIFISEQDSLFPKMWNKHCGGQSGVERAKSANFRLQRNL